MEKKQWDIIIIGGGLAGYVAANYLAKANLSTLILEKSKEIGGRARTINKKGYLFNLGPHALYRKGKAATILGDLSIELKGRSPAGGGTILYNQVDYLAPFSFLNVLRGSFLSIKERFDWIKVVTSFNQINQSKVENQTFQQWVEQTTASHRVQALIYALARLATYCHAPELVNARVVLSHLSLTSGGTLYLDGGWQQIMNQLHDKALLSNSMVQTDTTVTKLELNDQQQWQVETNNNETHVSNFVLYTGAPEHLQQVTNQQLNSSIPPIIPIKGAAYDIALSTLPDRHQLFALDLTDSLYYSVHSTYAKLGHHNHIVLHLFKYLHPTEDKNTQNVKEELEQFLERLQPNWKQHVKASRFMPNITVNQRLPQLGEDHYFNNQETELPRLYVAGDWADPQLILAEGAINSGKNAALEIIAKNQGGMQQ
ncbi:phytoene desaturase family protein [Halalkalibacter sp. AB-rgal2]|uniref:phytoene desaturase family protein n=1 Tax=Halalkalibacter sp. AB-rgal2 TaxID=3242695 RepID=UPI00359E6223